MTNLSRLSICITAVAATLGTGCEFVDSSDYEIGEMRAFADTTLLANGDTSVSIHFLVQEPGSDLAPEFVDLVMGDWVSATTPDQTVHSLDRINILNNIFYQGAFFLQPYDTIYFDFHRDSAATPIGEATLLPAPDAALPANFDPATGATVTFTPEPESLVSLQINGLCVDESYQSDGIPDAGEIEIPAIATTGSCDIEYRITRTFYDDVSSVWRSGSVSTRASTSLSFTK